MSDDDTYTGGRYRCVHRECPAVFDVVEDAREHERDNHNHWITDTEQSQDTDTDRSE
jgi:hypothetical protein